MDIRKRFGAAVRQRRGELGISQEDLALRISADQAYVSRIEAGQMNITLTSVEKIAVALSIDPGELFRN